MAQRTTAPSIDQPPPEPERLRMSYEQFQDWYTEGRRGEWVDGEVIEFVAPKTVHQRISRFLTILISSYVEERHLGEVLQTPEMRLRDGGSYREPDLAFVTAENAARITADGIDGPADLVIEIISDDSVRRDRRHKFEEYADAGVREYWVVDPRPLRQTVYAHVLGDEGIFNPIAGNEAGQLSSVVVPGFWIDPAWLWQEPLPDPRAKLAEIASAGD